MMPGDEAVPRRPLYLSAADCRKLLTPEAIVRSIEETLLWDTEGGVRWSDPRSMRMSDRLGTQYHLKACVLEPALVAGVRLVAHQSDEARGTATRWIIVLDAATALPLAIVDETWTYAQRTVAVMAVAAQKLASRGRVLALVGAGRLAAAAGDPGRAGWSRPPGHGPGRCRGRLGRDGGPGSRPGPHLHQFRPGDHFRRLGRTRGRRRQLGHRRARSRSGPPGRPAGGR